LGGDDKFLPQICASPSMGGKLLLGSSCSARDSGFLYFLTSGWGAWLIPDQWGVGGGAECRAWVWSTLLYLPLHPLYFLFQHLPLSVNIQCDLAGHRSRTVPLRWSVSLDDCMDQIPITHRILYEQEINIVLSY
jgi:hypothetical protein